MNRVAIMREAIIRVAKMLAEKDIEVTQRGVSAYVEYDKTGRPVRVNLPFIPDDANETILDAAQGFLDHEIAHIYFTDYAVAKQAEKMGVQGMWNKIEDTFIERKMAERFAGSGLNLNNTGEFFIKHYIEPELKKDPNSAIGILFTPAVRAWAGQPAFADFMASRWGVMGEVVKRLGSLVDQVKNCDSSQDCLDLAVKFQKALGEPEQKNDQNEEGEGEDEGESKDKKDKSEQKKGQSSQSGEGEPGEKSEPEKSESEKSEPEKSESGKGEDESSPENGEGEPGEESEPKDDESEDSESGNGSGGEDDKESKGESGGDGDSEEESSSSSGSPSKGKAPSGDDGKGKKQKGKNKPKEDDDDGGPSGKSSGGGGGFGQSNLEGDESLLDKLDDAGAFEDFSKAVAKTLTSQAIEENKASDYTVYTKEYDKIEHWNPEVQDHALRSMQDSVDHMVGPLQKDLERAVAARSASVWSAGHRSGRLNASSLARLTQFNDDRAFRRKQVNNSRDVAVSLLIDCSGSMKNDNKLRTAAYSAFGLSAVLDRMNMANEVIGFTTTSGFIRMDDSVDHGVSYSRKRPLYMPIFKEYSERMSPEVKGRLAALPHAQFCWENADSECVQIAANRLAQRREARKILLVLSDGMPSCAGSTSDQRAHLKKVTKEIARAGIDIVGIGIADESPKHFYDKFLLLNNVSELPGAVMGELKRLLMKA